MEKFFHDLSGGEKQRVALARALAIQPRVLLLDEPLSALDPCFRGEIQRLVKELHTSLGTTFLMVTHDYKEAFYLGDRVGIISKGRVKRVGGVDDVFLRPKNVDVGKFVEMKNIFHVGDDRLSIGNLSIGDNHGTLNGACGLRPEDVEVNLTNAFHSECYVGSGILHSVVKQGFVSEVTISSGDTLILAHGDEKRLRTKEMDIGVPIYFAFSPDSLHHFSE